ncbi:OmpA family protein [Flavobacteriaceae bacterium]|nr:OmpA family protein [Flavobacteriaceae bacterium]
MKNLFYTLLLFPLFAFSQLSFEGVVKDKLTATELEKALVTVKPRRVSGAGFYSGVYTKADGAFEVTTSFDYPLEIIITKKGCTRKVIKIKKGETYIDVVMECEAATIEQIIVEKTLDTDGDGVLDVNDNCKEVAGDKENEGCPWPDDDNDGVANKDDACPDEAGTAADKGCPSVDADGDGVADKDDACPNEAGTAATQGCPASPKTIVDFLQSAEGTILFTADNDVQKSSYDAVISGISELLKKYPNVKLQIEGHASSDGSKAYNQKLSDRRAANVKEALVQMGIEASRLSDVGFGEDNPKDSNATAAGRANNRRVSLSMQ